MLRTLASLGAAAALAACVQVDFRYQRMPDRAALQAIVPGTTTRSEVLRALGPPEEYRLPSAFDFVQRSSVQRRRVLGSGRVFDREELTWAARKRRVRSLGLLPGGLLPLLVWTRSHAVEERWMVRFDEHDVVTAVAHVDEGARP